MEMVQRAAGTPAAYFVIVVLITAEFHWQNWNSWWQAFFKAWVCLLLSWRRGRVGFPSSVQSTGALPSSAFFLFSSARRSFTRDNPRQVCPPPVSSSRNSGVFHTLTGQGLGAFSPAVRSAHLITDTCFSPEIL